MATGTDFLLQLQQKITGASLVTELARMQDAFTSAKAKYVELESEGAKLQKKFDSIGGSVSALREKMADYMAAGNEKAFWKAATALQAYEKEQTRLQHALGANKGALGEQAKSLERLGNNYAAAVTNQKKFDAIARAGAGAKKLGGPIGKVGDVVNDTIESFESLEPVLGETGALFAIGAAGAIALVAALGAVGIVVGVVALGVAAYAVKLADARRETELTIDAMSRSGAAASSLSSAFSSISHDTGLASDRLLDITRQLKQAHVASRDLPDALRAIAIAESALGDSSGNQELIDRLKSGQTSAAALAKEMDQRLGGVVQKRMLGLSEQWATLQRNISGIFGTLNIEPLLIGISKLVGLLDESSASGQALRTLFASLFQPLLDNAGPVFIAIERFILGAELALLDVAIFVKRASKEVAGLLESFGLGTDSLSGFVDAADVGYAVMLAFGVVLLGLGVIAIGVAAPFVVLGAIILGAIAIFAGAAYAAYSAGEAIQAIDWKGIGLTIVDGLLGPLRDPTEVTKAFTDFATNGVNAVKTALDSHSPSRVLWAEGENAGDGMIGGVKSKQGEAERALAALGAGTPAPAASNGGGSLVIQQTNHFDGVKDAADAKDRSLAELVAELEGAALGGAT